MLSGINSILNHFDDPSILFTGIFRVDGIPILVKCRDKIAVLSIVDWLDKHIKNCLEKIISEDFERGQCNFQEYFC